MRALTEPTLLAEWLMATDMRPLVGNSFTFKAEPAPWWDGIVHCEVLEVDSPFAFDGARKGWQRMVGERLREVLVRAA